MRITLALFFYFCTTTTAALRNPLKRSTSSPIASNLSTTLAISAAGRS
jgi:hypothetical protein